ncbi:MULTISPECIES: hypothetical protein [unclassified Agrococcus]|uniref:hypothetical protein n=1 Tax=unclassified Agrococcus TaxID=2615065 RepID=UPI0036233BBB
MTTGTEPGASAPPHVPSRARGRAPRAGVVTRWLPIVLLAAVGGLWLVLRIPQGTFDVLWAEDGRDFLADALERGGWAVLLEPYAGYLHLLPRLVTAVLVAVVPLELHAVAVTLASIAFVVAVAVATFVLSADVVRWWPARLGIAAVPIVLPALGAEVLGNLANLHTYCLWLGCWILLAHPRRGIAGVAWAGVLLACMLTEVQAVLLVPLALAMLRPRRRETWLPVVATLVGAAAQVAAMLLSPREGYPSLGIGIPDIVLAWLVQAVLPIVDGSRADVIAALADVGPVVGLAALVPFAIAGVVGLVRGTSRQRIAVVTLALLSAGIMAGCILTSQLEVWRYASLEGEEWLGAVVIFRYGAAAGMYCAALVPLAAGIVVDRDRDAGWRRARIARVATASVVVVAAVGWMAVQAPETGSSRPGGAAWSVEVDEAQAACDAGADEGQLEVAPAGWSGGLAVLTCDALGDEP